MTLKRLAQAATSLLVCLALASCYMPMDYGGTSGTGTSGASLEDLVNGGLAIQAERGSGTLDIRRMQPGGTRPANIVKNTWTVFVYLCGSDLESQGGAATNDLKEMISASKGNNVSFVVETGGAKTWRNNTVSSRKLGRYLIRGGKMSDVGSLNAANMGESQILSDFITWGVKTYPAEHMGLILWDHGGGSISGVCFDERAGSDSLLLRELDQGLSGAFASMWQKFDFVGFDACLMCTLETANVLATYADYLYASQESEPATGWDYTTIMKYLESNPSCDAVQLGERLCQGYLASMDRNTKGFATLAVVDLSRVDDLMQDFYRFSQEIYASGEEQATMAAMARAITKAENYGCNNRREGYTNMVDLGGLVQACKAVAPSASDVLQSLHDAVVYQVRGTYHADASGLSLYYPLQVNASRELQIFETVAANPSYLSFVGRLAHGATYGGGTTYQQYSDDTFWVNDLWSLLLGNTGPQLPEEQVEDHWDYVDDHTQTAVQPTFASEPQVDDEGTYWFQLDAAGLENAAVVSGVVYERSEDGTDNITLGETYDVYGDWNTGEFADGFDGGWLSLPDGQNLNLSVVSATEDYTVFTSPIELNGQACYLRMVQDVATGNVTVEGTWAGLDAGGSIDRAASPLKKGDVIVPLYPAYSADENLAASEYEGDPYTVGAKGLTVDYSYLPEGDYLYCFCIQDAFGNCTFTDTAQFQIDADGTIYFE